MDVKIPGGVHAYVVDLRGERCVLSHPLFGLRCIVLTPLDPDTATIMIRHEATPDIWQETYVSALLRAILYSDDPTYWLDAYRKLDPITTGEGEVKFLQAVEALFMKGVSWTFIHSLELTLTLARRLASWLRPRDPSSYDRLEPPHSGGVEIFRCERTVSASCQSL